MKHTRFFLICILALLHGEAWAQQTKLTRQEYIEKYKDIAIKNMKEYGIPASITLAQGCFESGDGNSRLAVEANNHFGIKCQQTWTGGKIFHDDDAKQECFRKYENSEQSYSDHADFLRYRDRYSFLFELPSTDYKAWAHGLKKAGYATNPQYAERLINIIEEYNLHRYDVGVVVSVLPPTEIEVDREAEKPIQQAATHKINLDNYSFEIDRTEYTRNGVRFIKARPNDTYGKIAAEYNTTLKKLLSYNDLIYNINIEGDQVVFLESKKKRASTKQPIHIAEEGETLHEISQRYAVQLKSLYKFNNMKADERISAGTEIFLREFR